MLALLPSSALFLGQPMFGAEIDAAGGSQPSGGGFKPLVAADRSGTPVLAPASSEGTNRIRQFKLAPGLKVDLWAAEPMLANPVAFSVDGRGRVFTSETYRYRSSVLDIRHYMFMLEDDLASRNITNRLEIIRKWFGPGGEKALSAETEVIRRIEDTDGDGKADVSTVFADGFNSPLSGIGSGVLARDGEVWFTEIPSLWRLRPDTESKGSRVEESKGAATPPSSTVPPFNSSTHLPLASAPHAAPGYKAEELLRGFGVRFSFTGHDLHGLILGPDGRLYFSVGDRGAHVVTREGRVIDLPDEGAVFRCEPDGSDMEVVHRGLRNPQELAFNDQGDLFTGDNDSDQGDRERWVQVVEGADSGWRVGHQHAPLGNAGMWNLERLWVPHFEGQAAYVHPPIANIADGPSGLVYMGGVPLGSAGGNRFLLAYFKGTSARSGVDSIAVRQKGAGYELVAHDEFVWNSLVPDVDLAPDGSILFADWHEGWPKSNKGRIYRAWFPEVLADPVSKETARLLGEGFSKRPDAELVSLLAHRDLRVRQEAQYALAARGAASVPRLRIRLKGNGLMAIHAARALGQIARKDPAQAVWALLPVAQQGQGELRVQALRALGSADNIARYPGVRSVLAGSLEGTPARIQAAAALGLARALPDASESRRVVEAIRAAGPGLQDDRVLFGAFVQALSATDPAFVGTLVADPAFEVRLAAVLAWRRGASPGLARFLQDPDVRIVVEAARAIHDVPVPAAMSALAALGDDAVLKSLRDRLEMARQTLPPTPNPSDAIRDVRADQPLPWTNAPVDLTGPLLLRIVDASFRVGDADAAIRLGAMTIRADLPETVRIEALQALGSWEKPPARDRIVGVWRPLPARDAAPARAALLSSLGNLLADSSEAVAMAATVAAADLRLEAARPALASLVRNASAPVRVRASALRSLHRGGAPAAEVRTLSAFAAADTSEELRLEASRLQAELDPNDAAGALRLRITGGTILEQQAAYTSLGDLKSDAADALLADALERLMKREVANEVMLDLVEAARKRTAPAVTNRLAAYQEWKLPKDHLSPYREALSGGDAARGRKLFYEHAAVACTRCHQIGSDSGGNAGPKLDGIAGRTTAEHLLESVVFPNRQISQGFETTMITTRTGGLHAGVVKSEDASSLTIATPDEGDVKLAKSDIKTRERGVSGMPEGFGDQLNRFELRDLLEFLGTLK
jgi:quinoprotein glucose dehydrogenase